MNEHPSKLHKLRTMHLFAGAGGGLLADLLLGHQPVCAVEIEPYCQQVLSARQKDGVLPWFPIFDDVTTFDGTPWRGKVDVISGGFPCPDFSNANQSDSRQSGLDGERGSLWHETARIIGEVRPTKCFLENVTGLIRLGLPTVLSDLYRLGYDARWCVLGSRDTGGVHKRERVWIYAFHADSNGLQAHQSFYTNVQATNGDTKKCRNLAGANRVDGVRGYVDPCIAGKNDAVAFALDRFKAIGNGQDATVAALAWRILSGLNEKEHTT